MTKLQLILVGVIAGLLIFWTEKTFACTNTVISKPDGSITICTVCPEYVSCV